jgi:hypothetical protein
VCAVDARGVYAVLSYERLGKGFEVPMLELVAALGAVPVRRGEPRVTPGSRVPAAAAVSIRCDAAGAPNEVQAVLQAAPRAKKAELSIARGTGRFVVATRR